MSIVLVLDNPKDWPLNIDGVQAVSARTYLTDPIFSEKKQYKIFNLCRSYRYQSLGYYVSLLAHARGHRALPEISTIQDLKLSDLIRVAAEDLDDDIQEALADVRPPGEASPADLTLTVYFGQSVDSRLSKLAMKLFNHFPAPFLKAQFLFERGRWLLATLRTVPTGEIPPEDFLHVLNFATHYFNKPHRRVKKEESRYDLAILASKDEKNPPSNEKALKKFIKAAEAMGIDAEIIDKDDYGSLGEFDALFIRDTTSVNHYTFRFARRAAAEGLVVIDDPDSIVRCSNKVYLHELLVRHKIATPPTMVLHRDNWEDAPAKLGLPMVLKQPDSAFSLGVIKAKTIEDFERECERLFKISDMLVAQAFTPSTFDWRVGVLDKEPIFVCKYFMANNHWQIYDNTKQGDDSMGDFETWPVAAAPTDVVRNAVKAAGLIGNGLYGVDLKEINGKALVIEVNDNPNIDAGVEDEVLGDELYARVMRTFLTRLEQRGR